MTDEYREFEVAAVEQTMSDDIGKLALALSKAQGEITGALKNSKNPFFKSNYSDLSEVLAAIREPLSKNELAVVQTTEPHSTGVVVISTLMHSSGQWIRGKLKMTPTKNDPQGVGSCVTYARRYGISALVGVAQIDDDGNAATHAKPKTVKPDREAIALLEKSDSMELLESVWKSLTPAQRESVGKDRLAQYKQKVA